MLIVRDGREAGIESLPIFASPCDNYVSTHFFGQSPNPKHRGEKEKTLP